MRGDIAVVGATGAVGLEALSILRDRGVDRARVRALASGASEGMELAYGDGVVRVERLTHRALEGVTAAIFAASAEVAWEFAPAAVESGVTVVDNSSAFRLRDGIPLVVPEVNGGILKGTQRGGRLIANPNCSAVILAVALEPLRRAFGVEAVVVATYQAVSGAGLGGIEALRREAAAGIGASSEARSPGSVFQEPCAFNVFSHDSDVEVDTGVNGEERKMIEELRKIWGDASATITPTCVRVPVVRAHTQAVVVELSRGVSEEEVFEALRGGDGLEVVDDRAGNRFPTPLKAAGRDAVLVGRVRRDPSGPVEGKGQRFCLMVCGDQLRKGAALNAVQVLEACGNATAAGAEKADFSQRG